MTYRSETEDRDTVRVPPPARPPPNILVANKLRRLAADCATLPVDPRVLTSLDDMASSALRVIDVDIASGIHRR